MPASSDEGINTQQVLAINEALQFEDINQHTDKYSEGSAVNEDRLLLLEDTHGLMDEA